MDFSKNSPFLFFSYSDEETSQIGEGLGKILSVGQIVCLFGDLGAGKTTFLKGLVHGAASLHPDEVNSPTFSYLNIYSGKKIVYHFDLYRLKNADEFLAMGFDEYLFGDGICCVEWPERISSILPQNFIEVKIDHEGGDRRNIAIKQINDHRGL